MPEVVEAYRDYSPPCNATAIVEDLLESVPEAYPARLWRVVLTNAGALTGRPSVAGAGTVGRRSGTSTLCAIREWPAAAGNRDDQEPSRTVHAC